ncbi:MAG: histidinol phosphate phosphatase domain-containing protein [Deltaproteobacteria bacterium]|jgi:histidinol phosphatase-like PHP family hydrolase|nr:histidinol phosphate phosphatase domain-containing protein [Deltaproteobacteria bacterium]MDO9211722.1 histidinol phosphate phosphatase domain-containing protein [Deltaproteobacteria bacterium]MDP3040956.1 histidinol phosphate phosphatase domain-containing protein [Deltaproteobacteria bacterium]
MIDLHTHSLFSDGELLPSELVRRASVIGCQAVAITDHADSSNLDWVIPRMVQVCRDLKAHWQVRAIPGVELTHIPPDLISPLTVRARTLGAQIVLVHGETIVEPVPPGTNQQAIAAGVDILAHPGLIAEEEVVLAREKGVFLEITARKGHSLTNGHVARLAKKVGASLVLNTDTHAPDDLISQDYALKIALGAGLTNEDFERMQENAWKILDRMS